MTNTPERYDHHEDGMEIARDGDFVFYDDYTALLFRAEQAVARVAELEKACAEWVEVSQSNYKRAKRAEARVKELEAEREEDHKKH
jgi:diphthamide biosynthesis methyltransferase